MHNPADEVWPGFITNFKRLREEELRPTLKPCKRQKLCEANEGDCLYDRLTQLPDDILLDITSSLSIKEAATTSTLSRCWNSLWRYLPNLVFENYAAMERMGRCNRACPEERACFRRWVNAVVEGHRGLVIDELKIAFHLDNSSHLDIDKWLDLVSRKHLKKLVLDFAPPHWGVRSKCKYKLPLASPSILSGIKSSLTSLCLKCVDVSSADMECLLLSCSVLESLSVHVLENLSCIQVVRPLELKNLVVEQCMSLETIDIVAPKLLSFAHRGGPIQLHIRNAYSLSKVAVGSELHAGDVVTYAISSLSRYFPQLEYLQWHMCCIISGRPDTQLNLGINHCPPMTNLKHLELYVRGGPGQSLLGWTSLIEAAPVLEKLTLNVSELHDTIIERNMVKRNDFTLKSLKTLEVRGFTGDFIDVEFAICVIENSIVLEEVIVDFRPWTIDPPNPYMLRDLAVDPLRRVLPLGVKLTIINGS